MNVCDRMSTVECAGRFCKFCLQQPEVRFHRAVRVCYVGMASAEPAQLLAERDVEIEGNRHAVRQLANPLFMQCGCDTRVELHGGWVACVAGNTRGKESCKINHGETMTESAAGLP